MNCRRTGTRERQEWLEWLLSKDLWDQTRHDDSIWQCAFIDKTLANLKRKNHQAVLDDESSDDNDGLHTSGEEQETKG